MWILRILVAALFLLASFMKLSGQPMMIQEFDTVGLGQWFRYFTGLLELAGAVAVVWPSVSVFGAAVLLLVDTGAFLAQVFVIHVDWIHTIVLGAVLVLLIAMQRAQFTNRLAR